MLDGRVLGASQVEYKPFGKPPKERDTGNAGIPWKNPALDRDLQHKCQYKCHLYSHSCRAKPLYALNFNMSEYMSDEHVLGRFASELHAELHAGSSQKMVGACFQPRPDTPARRVIRIIRIIRSYGHTVIRLGTAPPCRAKPQNLHSPRVPCYTRLTSTCRWTDECQEPLR